MKTKLLALILSLAWTLPSFAQVKAYIEEDDGFFSTPSLNIDGKKIELNNWVGGFQASEAMQSNPTAVGFAKDHERYAKVSSILAWSGLAAAVTYSFTTSYKDYNSGTYWGLFALGFIPSLYFSRQSGKALMNSINAYNGVQRSASNDLKLNFYLIPSSSPQAGLQVEF